MSGGSCDISDVDGSLMKDAEQNCGYFNGRWLPVDQWGLHIEDLGFLQAVTAVERLRTYGGRLFQPHAHLTRLSESLRVLQINQSVSELQDLLEQWCDRNRAWVKEQGEASITLFVTPGRKGWGPNAAADSPLNPGSAPTVGLYGRPLKRSYVQSLHTDGQAIVVTDVRQPSAEAWPRGIKVRCRLHYYLADLAANQAFPNAAGVLVDDDGSLTETSVANLAIFDGAQIISPPVDRVLSGVSQGVVRAYSANLGIGWTHRPLMSAELGGAQEILLMGTSAGIWNAYLPAEGQRYPRCNELGNRLRAAFPESSSWHNRDA